MPRWPTNANGLQVLEAVAEVRTENHFGPTLCAIDGYPAKGCANDVSNVATPADDGFLTSRSMMTRRAATRRTRRSTESSESRRTSDDSNMLRLRRAGHRGRRAGRRRRARDAAQEQLTRTVRPQHLVTHPRVLHPGAWWLWALGLAAAASRTTNPVPLLLIVVVSWFVVTLRRDDAPWASSYALFFKLALIVIAIHVVFQALLSTQTQGLTVLFTLPEIPLPEGVGIKLGGEVTLEAVLNAVYFGLQLAAIFCCIGAANALGSARRLLRYMPAALYEIGIAAVIALTFAPQLVTDAGRVRSAARLRGSGRGIRHFGRLSMPILEGALERSVDLAAAMDARGYGRTTNESPSARRVTAGLVLLGSFGLLVGVYGLLTAHGFGTPLLLAGAASASSGCGWAGGVPVGPATAPTPGRCPS